MKDFTSEEIKEIAKMNEPRIIKHLNSVIKTRNLNEIIEWKILLCTSGFTKGAELMKGANITKNEMKELMDNGRLFWIKIKDEYWVKLNPIYVTKMVEDDGGTRYDFDDGKED